MSCSSRGSGLVHFFFMDAKVRFSISLFKFPGISWSLQGRPNPIHRFEVAGEMVIRRCPKSLKPLSRLLPVLRSTSKAACSRILYSETSADVTNDICSFWKSFQSRQLLPSSCERFTVLLSRCFVSNPRMNFSKSAFEVQRMHNSF